MRITAAVCLSSVLSLQAVSAAFADTHEEEMVKVWKVDFSGHPPFRRELIKLPAAEVAALEEANKIVETRRKMVVDFSGKPPFRRKFEDVPVIAAASLEVAEAVESNIRERPPGSFKRHR